MITLSAISDLLFDSFEVHRVLVVAPLRVARDTWPTEIQKWSHLRSLTYAVAVGTLKERKAALMQRADITIINRENLQWLIDDSGFPFDFDMTVDRDEDGHLYYEYQTSQEEAHTMNGSRVRLSPYDVLHIPGLGFDGLVGYSPIAMAKNSIGMCRECRVIAAAVIHMKH